jgi:hypothetical protein
MTLRHDQGSWISGPMNTNDEFNPAYLSFRVKELLAEHGVRVDLAPGQMSVVSLAAADLLRALGVAPASDTGTNR